MKLKRFVQNNFYLLIITSFSLIAIIYLLVFFAHFNTLSDNIDDYSSFAGYLGGLGSIASIATLIIVLFDNNQIKKEKLNENKQKNILYLVEHFEINEIEKNILTSKDGITHYLDNTKEYSEEYLQILKSIFERIRYLYESALKLNNNLFTDQIKYVIINRISINVLESLIEIYNNEDSIDWLRMENDKWRLNMSMKKREDF